MVTSAAVRPKLFNLSGLIQTRMAYWEPNMFAFADAGNAPDRIENTGGNVVAQRDFIEAVVRRRKREKHHEIARGFRDDHALLLHGLRQTRRGQLHFVLHLNLRGVGIGSREENTT